MSSSSSRKQGGRSGRSRGGGRRNKPKKQNGASEAVAADKNTPTTMRDEDVLIAFAPFVRQENAQALQIQHAFQSSNDQQAFVRAARQFLQDPNPPPPQQQQQSEPPPKPLPANVPFASDLEQDMTGLTVKEDPVVAVVAVTQSSSPPRTPTTTTTVPPPGLVSSPPGNWLPSPPGMSATTTATPVNNASPSVLPSSTSTPAAATPNDKLVDTERETPAKTPSKPVYQPKRLWTRIEQQPGRLLCNNVPFGNTVTLRPKQELTAQWVLPVKYIQQHAAKFHSSPERLSLRDAVNGLCIGLFRRGCTDNASSIITKEVVSEERNDYPFQVKGDVVVGTIPFYSPRTPGNVVLRLYYEDDALYTLATGPTLNVQVAQQDVESTLRFILSNFKTQKGSATSLSSLVSFNVVLESIHVPPNSGRHGWEGAGRAAWGCLCESRKVYETCAREYGKTKDKLAKLEVQVTELREQMEAAAEDEASEELAETLKEKTGALMGGRASNERKWRDAQVAFANILKSIVTNPSCKVIASQEVVMKSRLELELWCQLCESFAPSPFNKDPDALCVNVDDFPQQMNAAQFRKCADSRSEMQLESLGFVPNFKSLEKVLAPKEKARQGQPNHAGGMDPTAVAAMNRLSAAMGELYQREYMVSDQIHRQREMVRSHVESFVSQCDAFPPGTRVVVFGSSANGFGSPSSDLDMCLQLPPNTKLSIVVDEEEEPGPKAMGQLAEVFEAGGMKEVDTVRLTARIPIVKFYCPRPDLPDVLVECDLSMQNPLACLNTSLLLNYSQIHPVTRVLASIIKRWAKSRDINSPSNHTLSTYGYILMLLHFLTYHKRTNSGLVATIDKREPSRDQPSWTPLLPNLQWMDPRWPDSPPRTPYLELPVKPKQLLPHPLDQNGFVVNTYFYRLNDPTALHRLQQRFPGQDLSLSILLASFFRYYAYEFDYKKHVVSLNATATHGMVDREFKAEMDAWRAYGTSLAIEDPFETFYDVAHVVKGPNFHRIRNEFAMAYTKIVSVATGDCGSWHRGVNVEGMSGSDLIDWICEPFVNKEEDGEGSDD